MWDTPEEVKTETVYYGDNRKWLERWKKYHGLMGLFDLIYLDPPFNSNANYLFDKGAGGASAQMKAFADTWRWTTTGPDNAQDRVRRICEDHRHRANKSIVGFRSMIGNSGMLAYLSYMADRLALLYDLLKETGSIYLHCDPTASHYLKCIMDEIFRPENFRNEITWKRTSSRMAKYKHPSVHDTILFYAKGKHQLNKVFTDHDPEYISKFYRHEDKFGLYMIESLAGPGITKKGDSGKPWRRIDPGKVGRHWAAPGTFPSHVTKPSNWDDMPIHEKLDYLDSAGLIYWPKEGSIPRFKRYLSTSKGRVMNDMILDIPPLAASQRTGHPTEKPLPLMERIIKASSKAGDLILDPFCGCGPFLEAGALLKRRIVGIDVSLLAVETITFGRLEDAGVNVQIRGIPEDFESAVRLAKDDPFEFERWAVQACTPGMAGNDQQRKDGGVDGSAKLLHKTSDGKELVLAQATKSRRPSIDKVKAFAHEVKTRSEVAAGVFITLHKDSWTADMQRVADSLGVFKTDPNAAEEFPLLQHWHVGQRYHKKYNLTPRLPEIGHPLDGKELPVKRGGLFRK